MSNLSVQTYTRTIETAEIFAQCDLYEPAPNPPNAMRAA